MVNLRAIGIVVVLACALLFTINVDPVVAAPEYDYDLAGAYDEKGFRDGAINCTIYRHEDSPYSFELDGTHNITNEWGVTFSFDLGFNTSRTYYLLEESEEIFVIKPTEPYYTYSFTVIDYLGVGDGFLEILININGTDTVVERWPIDLLSAIPFTLSWGRAYKVRLVCDRGTYYYPTFVAGATSAATLAVTSDMFPEDPTDISHLVVSAERHNVTYIKSIYLDAVENTTWIYMSVAEVGNATVLASTNVTDYSLTWNWYGADPVTNYYVRIIVLHTVRGELEWTIVCPLPMPPVDNPWGILDDLLGTKGFPIMPSQFIGFGIVMLAVAAFSRQNVGVGLVVIVLVTMILTYIGWLSMSWSWLTLALAVVILVALSIKKGDERII